MSQRIVLEYNNQQPLNVIADYIFLNKPALVERLDGVELIKGKPTLFGSGDDTILTIVLTYSNPSEEDLADIQEIIQIAKNHGSLSGASEIDIQINSDN